MNLHSRKRFRSTSQAVNVVSYQVGLFQESEESQKLYQTLFQKHTALGTLLHGSFENVIWTLQNSFGYCRSLSFDLGMYPRLNLALKYFALSLLEQHFSINHIQTVINSIKEIIHISRGFQSQTLTELEEYIAKCQYKKRNCLVTYMIQFFSFIQIEHAEKFIEVCTPFLNHIQQSRTLPNYQHVLYFNEKIDEFLTNGTSFEIQKYFPLVLWWKITTIIPLRPQEFLQLKRDCIVRYPNHDIYIRVPRTKIKANSNRDLDVIDTLQTNKKISNYIKQFHSFISKHDTSPYLISYSYYRAYQKQNSSKSNTDLEHMRTRQFHSLLDQFYREILQKKFHYTGADKINPGDTRHFAFCNMMLQGFNMLSIARIGGHTRLDKQKGYWGHLQYFTESWVYNLTEKNRRLQPLQESLSDANFTTENRKILSTYKLNQEKDYQDYRPVEYGYCLDPEFPEHCGSDCRVCSFYHFHPENDALQDGLTWLYDISHSLQRKIREQVSLLTYLSQQMKYDIPNLNYSIVDQEELSSYANELNRLLWQQAMVDSKIPKKVECTEHGEQKR
ncbi:site-specific integrase [Bacillus thuringiensis]|uniref:site-specific integrase n=1 Tax=Bacillus thuringiensis TaxID=1428 RepID=UPI000E46E7BB|nr:site-specific integrase [Bacillus thuringiensis]MDZ3952282.1 site-specific integrase [Bacillus thuringiensis]RGP53435.1 integrase [Bacillus thuringiensis]